MNDAGDGGEADDATDQPGWRRGPDPDEPPWAGREDGDREEPGQQPTAPPVVTDAREPDGDDQPGDADEDADDGDRVPAVIGPGAFQRPPKRTGVFVDPDDLRAHVGDLLRVFLGGYQVDAWGNFTFAYEDARVFVTVGMSPIGPQVGVFSITNLDIDLAPPLAAFLAVTNHKLGFGAFSYDEQNRAVWLRHTLLGTTLDAPELQAAVAAIASTAAHFDDLIRDRFGGRAFHDVPEEVQKATRPPEAADQHAYPNAGGYL